VIVPDVNPGWRTFCLGNRIHHLPDFLFAGAAIQAAVFEPGIFCFL